MVKLWLAKIEELQKHSPKKIVLCTLLFKPGKFVKDYAIDYIGKSIDDDFIVGYGLDYEGFGRNLSKIYKIKECVSTFYKRAREIWGIIFIGWNVIRIFYNCDS